MAVEMAADSTQVFAYAAQTAQRMRHVDESSRNQMACFAFALTD
jgi:hypothetical protein